MSKSENKSDITFLQTTPGIIAAFAALITAIGGCVAVIFGIPAISNAVFGATSTPIISQTTSSPVVNTPMFTQVPTQTLYPTYTPLPTFTTVPPTAPPPPTVAPIVITNTYEIAQYGGEHGHQRSSALDYPVTIKTVDLLQIEFSLVGYAPCADVFLHILLDGVEIVPPTDSVGPVSGKDRTGLIDLSRYVSRDSHKLTISPESMLGGCNTEGWLASWGGDLFVYTNEYP